MRRVAKEGHDTIAKERNQELRDDLIYGRTLFNVEQMVLLDESSDDCELAIPKRGYDPKGVTPIQRQPFHRGNRLSSLPAYTMRTYLL